MGACVRARVFIANHCASKGHQDAQEFGKALAYAPEVFSSMEFGCVQFFAAFRATCLPVGTVVALSLLGLCRCMCACVCGVKGGKLQKEDC